MWTLLERGALYVASIAHFDAGPLLARRTTPRAACTWLVGVLASLSLNAIAFGSDIRVFTDRAHPVRADADTPVTLLDAPAHLIASLGAHLPADPRRASELVAARLKEKGPAFQRELAAAYQGVIEAWRLGIAKIPAVVIDHRYVVYGEPDLESARSWIETYRSTHP